MEEKWRDLCFIIVATRRNTIGEKGNKVDKPEASGDIGVSLGSGYETLVYMDVVIIHAVQPSRDPERNVIGEFLVEFRVLFRVGGIKK